MGGCLSRIAGLGLVAMLATAGYHYMRVHRLAPVQRGLLTARTPLSWAGLKEDGTEHFSPVENLERLELSELRLAGQRARESRTPLRIAMYAFTDRAVAEAVITEADGGTVVELYRDGEQYEIEQRNGERFRHGSVTALFHGHQNIHVRVKRSARGDLMHLKAWSDGTVLREGSANWSPAGLKRQDNNVRFTKSPEEVKAFLAEFDALWNRPGNVVIQ